MCLLWFDLTSHTAGPMGSGWQGIVAPQARKLQPTAHFCGSATQTHVSRALAYGLCRQVTGCPQVCPREMGRTLWGHPCSSAIRSTRGCRASTAGTRAGSSLLACGVFLPVPGKRGQLPGPEGVSASKIKNPRYLFDSGGFLLTWCRRDESNTRPSHYE